MKGKATLVFLLTFTIFSNQLFAENGFKGFLAPPANDDCVNATEITVNSDFLCSAMTPGTVAEATASSTVNVCPGSATNATDDVWFKFTAVDTSHKIELLNISGSQTNLYFSVFDAGVSGDCTVLDSGDVIFCSDPDANTVSGLTVANIYYIRVFTNDSGSHDTTFDICVGTQPMAPVNDDCNTATTISSFPYSASEDATSATNNAGFIDVAGCVSAMNDGVWYTFTGDGGSLTVTAIPSGWDAQIGIYTGSCGAFVCEAGANNGSTGNAEAVTFTSVVGETYYLNVGNASGTTDLPEGGFNLNISSSVLSIDDLIARGFAFYPNPVRDRLQLSAKDNIRHLAVYNQFGQQLKLVSPSQLEATLDLSNFAAGAYFIRAYVGESVGIFKIIKQ